MAAGARQNAMFWRPKVKSKRYGDLAGRETGWPAGRVPVRPWDYPPLIRLSCSAHWRSRRTNFCTLPVEVFGSGPKVIVSGHL